MNLELDKFWKANASE